MISASSTECSVSLDSSTCPSTHSYAYDERTPLTVSPSFTPLASCPPSLTYECLQSNIDTVDLCSSTYFTANTGVLTINEENPAHLAAGSYTVTISVSGHSTPICETEITLTNPCISATLTPKTDFNVNSIFVIGDGKALDIDFVYSELATSDVQHTNCGPL